MPETYPFTDNRPPPPTPIHSLLPVSSTFSLQPKAISREREAVTAETVRLGAALTLLVLALLCFHCDG